MQVPSRGCLIVPYSTILIFELRVASYYSSEESRPTGSMPFVNPPRTFIVSRRHKSRRPGTFLSLRGVVASLAVVAVLMLSAMAFRLRPLGRSSSQAAKDGTVSRLPLGLQQFGQAYARKFSQHLDRLEYPYSVVSGGVANAAEAKFAVLTDPVVGAHYRHLDIDHLRRSILASDRSAYVSYRKGAKVFWTSKKIKLFKGETILTDGTSLVRGRCGNLVSDTPMGLTSREEPSAQLMNTPALPREALALVQTPGSLGPLASVNLEETPNPTEPQPAAVVPDSIIASASDMPEDPFTPAFGFPGFPYAGPGAPVSTNSGGTPGTPPPSGGGTTPGNPPPNTNPGGPATPPVNPPPTQPPGGTPPPTEPGQPPPPSVTPPRTFPGTPSPFPPFEGPPTTGRPSPDPVPLVPPPDLPPSPVPPGPDPGPILPVPDPDPGPTPASVPEPSSWLLVVGGTLGLLGLAYSNRRRRREAGAVKP